MKQKEALDAYAKPALVKHENLKRITFECPSWQCSVGNIDQIPAPSGP